MTKILCFLIIAFWSIQSFTIEVTLEKVLAHVKENNFEIKEVAWGEEIRQGQLDEAKAGFFPKLETMGILAPMYSIKGNALASKSTYDNWGPYYMLDARLIFPIFTFGKVTSYKEAATNGLEVSKTETESKKNEVIVKTKEYYYSFKLAHTMSQVINSAKSTLEEAIKTAETLYKKGKIKEQDYLKLKVYFAQLLEKRELIKKGEILAKSAIAMQMGYSQTMDLEIKDPILEPVEIETKTLDKYIEGAKNTRPDYKMVEHGLKAKKALYEVEKTNHYPVFFIGAQYNLRFATTVEDQQSQFARDEYNRRDPGAGIGFQWKWDYGTTQAKMRQANAEYMKIVEKAKYAEVGIPMDIKRNYYDLMEMKTNYENYKEALVSANKLLITEASGYLMGIVEAKDLLEAVAADAMSKYSYYNSVYNFNMAAAKLSLAVGEEVSKLKY